MTDIKLPVKIGQVYKSKNNDHEVFVVIAISKDGTKAINGIEVEYVNPAWEVSYLLENYILDERY